MEKIITLSSEEYKDLQSYCKLNNLNEEEVIKKSFSDGYRIEKYGLLSEGAKVVEKIVEKIVEKRIEVPVEKEVVRIEYVEKPVEVIKEVIKEVPVEIIKEVEKIFHDDSKIEEERQKFSTKTEEMENIFQKEKQELLDRIKTLENKPPDTALQKALETTLQKLKMDNIEKDKKIKELEGVIEGIKNNFNTQATYLSGSNLKNKLF